MPIVDDLLSIEKALWTGGPEAYLDHLDERCLVAFTEMSGSYTPEEVAAMVEEGPRWSAPTLENATVHQPDPGVAVLVYTASTVRGEESYRAVVGSGYARREDGWKMFFHQQTPLPG